MCSPGSQLDEDDVSDDDIEDCLGFVSSVAEANDVNWNDKHSGRNHLHLTFHVHTLYISACTYTNIHISIFLLYVV